MKINTLIMSLLISYSSISYANSAECTPSEKSPWTSASVSLLKDGAQALYKVKVEGTFRVADFICSYQDCVGFLNGIKSDAALEFDHVNGKYVPVALSFIETDGSSPETFNCTQN
ncbi:MAG: hypothetical protein V4596_01380 [Bdellovibrionota bacterium]